jgi:hypothetical protein
LRLDYRKETFVKRAESLLQLIPVPDSLATTSTCAPSGSFASGGRITTPFLTVPVKLMAYPSPEPVQKQAGTPFRWHSGGVGHNRL